MPANSRHLASYFVYNTEDRREIEIPKTNYLCVGRVGDNTNIIPVRACLSNLCKKQQCYNNKKPPAVGEGRRERRVRTRGVTRSILAREGRQTEATLE